MNTYPFHQSLTLKNFTVFASETLEFVPGINIFIGENGTGKSHLLKALYAWQIARHLAAAGQPAKLEQILLETFRVDSTTDLVRIGKRTASLAGSFGGDRWELTVHEKYVDDKGTRPQVSRPVFLPAIEMMAHAKNMNGVIRDYGDFDRTCFDFITMVTAKPILPDSDGESLTARRSLLPSLEEIIPGEIEWDELLQRFYLVKDGYRMPFSMVAEGIRKFAGLRHLVDNKWIVPGTILYWDEPEVNLNPQLMDELIDALIDLALLGVQVFASTHSYVILKELDLRIKSRIKERQPICKTKFFSFHKVKGATKVASALDFALLEYNPILDKYNQMFWEDTRLSDVEMTREAGPA